MTSLFPSEAHGGVCIPRCSPLPANLNRRRPRRLEVPASPARFRRLQVRRRNWSSWNSLLNTCVCCAADPCPLAKTLMEESLYLADRKNVCDFYRKIAPARSPHRALAKRVQPPVRRGLRRQRQVDADRARLCAVLTKDGRKRLAAGEGNEGVLPQRHHGARVSRTQYPSRPTYHR